MCVSAGPRFFLSRPPRTQLRKESSEVKREYKAAGRDGQRDWLKKWRKYGDSWGAG